MLNGEMISPPAGAIGRGDAFVLRIAERTGAIVLSNDSFQEFHGEHPWLFDDGPADRRQAGARRGVDLHAPAAHPGAQEPRRDGRGQGQEGPRVRPGQGGRAGQGGQEGGEEGGQGPEERRRRAGTAGRHLLAHHAHGAAPGPGQGRPGLLERHRRGASRRRCIRPQPEKSRGSAKKHAAAKKAGAAERAPRPRRTPPTEGGRRQGSARQGRRAGAPSDRADAQKQRSTPPPAVNEPLTFINFVAAFPVGSTIEGEVVSFTSHGAMVDVPLPGGGAHALLHPADGHGHAASDQGAPGAQEGRGAPLRPGRAGPAAAGGRAGAPGAARRRAEEAAPPTEKAAAPGRSGRRPTKAAPPTKKAAAKKAAAPAKKAAKKAVGCGQEGARRRRRRRRPPRPRRCRQEGPAKKSPAKKALPERRPR